MIKCSCPIKKSGHSFRFGLNISPPYGINHALAVSIGLIESVPKKLILCLCSTCADNFYGTGAYYLRRIDPVQVAKDTCTYCNQRKGYDYELVPKKR